MLPSHTLEIAKQGDVQAIATLIAQSLPIQNINVEVSRRDGCVYVLLTANTVPDSEIVQPFVKQVIDNLEDCTLNTLKISGYKSHQVSPVWMTEVELGTCSIEPPQEEPSTEDSHNPEAAESVNTVPPVTDRFIICGLGSLGQYCVVNLKKFADRDFNVNITAIDNYIPENWEIDGVVQMLSEPLIVDDCRKESVLERAGVRQSRAILLVTTDESANIETALAARRLNPNIRLVIRSARQNLYQLLKSQLGDFTVLDPAELPAAAFALAGLAEGTLGSFNIGDRRLRVVEREIEPNDVRFHNLPAYMLHRKTHLLLGFQGNVSEHTFHQWQPDARVKVGDKITYIEEVEGESAQAKIVNKPARLSLRQSIRVLADNSLLSQTFTQFWSWFQEAQSRPLVKIAPSLGVTLWLFSTILLKANVPEMSWTKAFTTGVILLLGGFGDVFGGLQEDVIPLWVKLICLLVTGTSILFLLGAFGLIADSLLSYRFDNRVQHSAIPEQDHIVLVGFGSIGGRVASLFQHLKQSMVVLSDREEDRAPSPNTPLLTGDLLANLSQTNLANAKSIVVVTKDQMLNLEIALSSYAANPKLGLVIRTFDQYFERVLSQLLPQAKSLCAYALSAEAFAGAAFGENMLSLFRLNNRTILVAEYRITVGDTLIDKMLVQIAYGYGVVPIFLQTTSSNIHSKITKKRELIMPSDDEYLHEGDRLVVLASISGLRRVERGELTPPRLWRLAVSELPGAKLERPLVEEKLERISGCSYAQAQQFLHSLPNIIELPLYDTQAYRLGHELSEWLTVKLFPA